MDKWIDVSQVEKLCCCNTKQYKNYTGIQTVNLKRSNMQEAYLYVQSIVFILR